MEKWKLYTPDGTSDLMFDECRTKREIENRIRGRFRRGGYMEIESPGLEFMDVFINGKEIFPQESMLKLVDRDGRILVLRPDVTIPVARIAATKLKDDDTARKIFYICSMYRRSDSGSSGETEFAQAGIELLGESSPDADAEVIAQAINVMLEAGLERFQLDIGQVDFFKGLMEETGLDADEIEEMRLLIDKKDFVGIQELADGHKIEGRLKELIFDLPRMFGQADILDRLLDGKLNGKSRAAAENLKAVISILADHGLDKYVSVDLGMVQSLNYYTGTIFKGFASGTGFPVLSGGRYDSLVGRFGKDCPATGFSIDINILMNALHNLKLTKPAPAADSLVAYTEQGRRDAIMLSEFMRKDGLCIDLFPRPDDFAGAEAYARKREIGGVLFISDGGKVEILDIKTGTRTQATLKDLAEREGD